MEESVLQTPETDLYGPLIAEGRSQAVRREVVVDDRQLLISRRVEGTASRRVPLVNPTHTIPDLTQGGPSV